MALLGQRGDRHVAMSSTSTNGVRASMRPGSCVRSRYATRPPPEAGPLRDFWLALPERRGRPPTIAVEAHSPDEGMEAVAAGHAIKLMAAGNVELYGRPDVVSRPVQGIGPAELAVVWPADEPRERPEVRTFVHACTEAAAMLNRDRSDVGAPADPLPHAR